jgi:hypothetical protein
VSAREPTAARPKFPPGYGISKDPGGVLPWSWATERLLAGRNFWVATTRPDGRPHAMPVWGVWLDGAAYFGASPESRKARNLARDPRVIVHLESGDEVVVLEGEAERVELDERIAEAFQQKYDWRPELPGGEGWFRVSPSIAYAWLERDYPNTATRFSFG